MEEDGEGEGQYGRQRRSGVEHEAAVRSAVSGMAVEWPMSLWNHAQRGNILLTLYLVTDVIEYYVQSYDESERHVLVDTQKVVFELDRTQAFGAVMRLVTRIDAIIQVLEATNELLLLSSMQIDGIAEQISRFQGVLYDFHRASYTNGPVDPFDLSNADFDAALRRFTVDLESLNRLQIEFLQDTVRATQLRPQQSLELLRTFQGVLKRPSVVEVLVELYEEVFKDFSSMLDDVRRTFEEGRENPPLPRRAPPLAGRLAWAHHLKMMASEPFEVFLADGVFDDDSRSSVHDKYASLVDDLEAYSRRYVDEWDDEIRPVRAALSAPLIVEGASKTLNTEMLQPVVPQGSTINIAVPMAIDSPTAGRRGSDTTVDDSYGSLYKESPAPTEYGGCRSEQELEEAVRLRLLGIQTIREFGVNFEFRVEKIVREASWMMRFGVSVMPDIARAVLIRKSQFFLYRDMLQNILKKRQAVIKKIRPLLKPLLLPLIRGVDSVIEPGLWSLSWMSINVQSFIDSCEQVLGQFESLHAVAVDIVDNRILKNIRIIGETVLMDLPYNVTYRVTEFVRSQQDVVAQQVAVAVTRSSEAIRGVIDLLNVVRVEGARVRDVASQFTGVGGTDESSIGGSAMERSPGHGRSSHAVSVLEKETRWIDDRVMSAGEEKVYMAIRLHYGGMRLSRWWCVPWNILNYASRRREVGLLCLRWKSCCKCHEW